MDPLTIVLLILVGIVIVAIIAWLIYKAGFRVGEITLKTCLLEAKMKRKPTGERRAASQARQQAPPRTEATQEASAGGQIIDTTITAPADSGAKLKQTAEGEGSKIEGSHIKVD